MWQIDSTQIDAKNKKGMEKLQLSYGQYKFTVITQYLFHLVTKHKHNDVKMNGNRNRETNLILFHYLCFIPFNFKVIDEEEEEEEPMFFFFALNFRRPTHKLRNHIILPDMPMMTKAIQKVAIQYGITCPARFER